MWPIGPIRRAAIYRHDFVICVSSARFFNVCILDRENILLLNKVVHVERISLSFCSMVDRLGNKKIPSL
jgi:hypothetical protein